MNELSVKNCDGVELTFNGKLIHQAETLISLEDQFNRKFLICVYAIQGGGFVSSLEYRSTCLSEKSVIWFEETDSFEDVEKFFYAFDFCELTLPTNGLSRDEKVNRERLTKNIAMQFEKLMFQFLDEVKQNADANGFGDRLKEAEKSGSIWDLFKVK